MKVITSRENPTYRDAAKLLRRKYREETGCYLLEGIKPLRDAVEAGTVPENIFIRDRLDTEDAEMDLAGAVGMISGPGGNDGSMVYLSGELFDRLSDTENSQGVIAVVRRSDLDAEGFLKKACKGNILLLDRLQDPGNVGTVIRTAEAAGITGMIALKGTVDIYSPKVVRAAAGSLFRMPVLTGMQEEEALSLIKKGGWKLAVSAVEGGEDCFSAKPEGMICLVVGNEGAGVSEDLMSEAETRLTIPMEGGIESLNAAVAAGILMYQINKSNLQK